MSDLSIFQLKKYRAEAYRIIHLFAFSSYSHFFHIILKALLNKLMKSPSAIVNKTSVPLKKNIDSTISSRSNIFQEVLSLIESMFEMRFV